MIKKWEILVPTVIDRNERGGKNVVGINTRFHRVWDEEVLKIANGITIMQPTIKGEWFAEDVRHTERTIPVIICCTESEIMKIGRMTRDYYNQLTIMVTLLSEKVLFIGE